ncbi:MAG TPA: PEP-CTERM sorting domain-containing protein [Lacipirellulaceae bacterium]|nr:PEP-CTERM sorting domain-containing protein [Lacipirellulaceae bacterium]
MLDRKFRNRKHQLQKNKLKHTLATLVLVAVFVQHVAAQVFDASAQFSPTSNPNSPWHYGFQMALGSGFTLYDTAGPATSEDHSQIFGAIDTWSSAALGDNPEISHNNTSSTFFASDPGLLIEWAANELALHPGPAGQYSILRFIAPAARKYQLDVVFQGIDQTGASTDVHVLKNNGSLFDQQVTGFHVPTSFSTALSLAQNDTIDFAVGFGANGNYFDDNTGTHVVITVVPEPSSLALTTAGIGLFIVSRAVHGTKIARA